MRSNNMSFKSAIQFTFVQKTGRIIDISTDSSQVNHFLDLLKMSRAYNTWLSYAHDLKVFFATVSRPPEVITRADCLAFMRSQDQAGCSDATINRRLAAVSALFNELRLLDPSRFPQNPVNPRQYRPASRQRSQSLYRKQPQRVPDVVSKENLHKFFAALPTWRDRTLVLLMWMSCLRISEATSIRFQHIECSRRSIRIPVAKGGNARTVFMDRFTFATLNRYLKEERRDLFPDVDHLFVALKGKARGQPLTVNAVQKMISYYATQCGLSHLHAHLFRHTGITQLVQQRMSEPAIRQLVGHRTPNALLPYLHLCDEFVEMEFDQAQAGLNFSDWLNFSLPGGEQ
jgi:integrase/recombinase XerC